MTRECCAYLLHDGARADVLVEHIGEGVWDAVQPAVPSVEHHVPRVLGRAEQRSRGRRATGKKSKINHLGRVRYLTG